MVPEKQNQRSALERWRLAAGLSALLGLAFSSAAFAQAVGTVTHSSGTVSVKRADGSVKLLGLSSEVMEGDRITTERETYTRVKFKDGGEVTLRPNTQVQVNNYSFKESQPEKDNFVLSLFKGGMRTISGLIGKRSRDNVAFKTPTATIGIRGTNFGMLLCQADCDGVPTVSGKPPEDGLHLDVADGAIIASNGGGSLNYSVGQFGFVAGPNVAPLLVPPANGVRVTVPSGIGAPGSGRGVGKTEDMECTIQ